MLFRKQRSADHSLPILDHDDNEKITNKKLQLTSEKSVVNWTLLLSVS